MKKIGITGGVGSGKSLVLTFLEDTYHAVVYQADLIAHEVQKPGEDCYKEVVRVFGEEILNEDGTINRGILGGIVFADPEKLQKLNEIVHPAVEQRIREFIEKEEAAGTEVFVLEAALLHKPVYREMLDEIWYIHVKDEVRRERLKESRGYSDEKITSMFASQPEEDVFRRLCDRVIENSGEMKETCRQLREAFAAIRQIS